MLLSPQLTFNHSIGATIPAKTSAQYIANLRDDPAEVWIQNERVADVTIPPILQGGATPSLRCLLAALGFAQGIARA